MTDAIQDTPPNVVPMWRRPRVWVGLIACVLLGIGIGRLSGETQPETPPQSADQHAHAQTWTCSMHPQVQAPEPGDCPICGMDLIPMADAPQGALDPTQVRLTPRARALAGVQTSEVQRLGAGAGASQAELVGRVVRDEDQVRAVTSWIGGRVDRLFVRTTGERVRKGQRLASVYSPQVYVAHKELLVAAKQVSQLQQAEPFALRAAQAQLEAARQKLKLLGLRDADLKQMQAASSPWTQVPVRSSATGTVARRAVSQGQVITQGSVLFEVVDLRQVWVELDAYEAMLPSLKVGQEVTVTLDRQDTAHTGTISFISPTVDTSTQVALVRVEVPNRDRALKPGMIARARIDLGSPSVAPALTIPDTAPLFAGARALVYVQVSDTAQGAVYEVRAVTLGARVEDAYIVRAGLSLGEQVVTHGAFVLDSELQIRGQLSLMARPDDTTPAAHPVVDLSPEQARALEPVLLGYLDVQERLVADDLSSAKARAQVWSEALEAIALESADAKRAYEPLKDPLGQGVQALVRASDLEGARAEFSSITRVIDGFLSRFGNVLDAPIRKAYCPMARSNKGDYWYQRGEQVRNVYFGKSMLACGEIQRNIDPSTALLEDIPTSQEGSHAH